MSAVKLPRSLEVQLGDLAVRVRRLWVYRGTSRWAVVVLLTAAAAVLADVYFDLPAWGRLLVAGGGLLVVGFAYLRLVRRPMRDEIPVPVLAAAIEDQFPSLAERLTTLVELSERADPGNGSKALIDVLARDTAQRAKRMDFRSAAPTASTARTMALAVLAAAVVLTPAMTNPGTMNRLKRFLLPWVSPTATVGFAIQVSSKDVVIKRGDTVTLTAYLERLTPDAELPDTVALVFTETDPPTDKKLPMTGDEKAAFHVTRPGVTTSFRYHVEAAGVVSETFSVTVVDPVELADGSATVIDPPTYATGLIERRTAAGVPELDALQHSRIRFDLRFARPAASATFDWKPTNEALPPTQFFVQLTDDRTGGTADWLLVGDGVLRLTVVGEKNVKTELAVATKATIDTPPKFERVSGVSENPRDVRPGERVPIELTVTDDVRLEKLELEFERNDDPSTKRLLAMTVAGVGSTRADGRYSFDLTDRGVEGETVRFRIRATDNRSVPEADAGPQVTYYPSAGWSLLKLSRSAKPLAEQDVLAKKTKIQEQLRAAAADVAEAARDVATAKREATGQKSLTPEQIARLDNAKGKAKDAARRLDDLARDTALTPDLRPFAAAIQQASEGHLRPADDHLRKAQNEAEVAPRDAAIRSAAEHLSTAHDRLTALIDEADTQAQNLLDKKKLEQLADEQKQLAEELKKDPTNVAKNRDIARRQQELNAQLDALLKTNESLRKAAEDLARENARRLADEAKRLAEQQRRLDAATDATAAAAQKQTLDAASKKQKELAAAAEKLRQKTQPGAAAAGIEPLHPDAAGKAAELLDAGNPLAAMTEQEKAARELDRLADALAKAAADRRDPKKAADQLAKLEGELAKQAAAPPTTEAARKQRADQQAAVRNAVEQVTTPPNDAASAEAKRTALAKLQAARDAAADADPTNDAPAMTAAAQAVQKLADTLPGREQRLKAAKAELEKLTREQEAVQKQVEDKLKGFEKKTPDAATRKDLAEKLDEATKQQRKIAEKLADLDTPGHEGRREKAAAAARAAATDMAAGRSQDLVADQQQARRQAEHLRQALDGQTPNDVRVDELAKQQRQLADQAEALRDRDPQQLQKFAEQERDLAGKVGQIADLNAAQQLDRARESVRKAAAAAQAGDVDELKKSSREAADQLAQLADLMAASEPAAAKADRLAREQEQAAEKAQKPPSKTNPATDPAAAREALARRAEELRQTPGGDAQEAKRKATDALEKLARAPQPDRAAGLQKEAAEALRNFAKDVSPAGPAPTPADRGDPDASRQPPDAGGLLPNSADAQEAKKQAEQQRQNRDAVGQAKPPKADAPPVGPMNPPTNPVEQLADRQQKLADRAEELTQQAGPQAGQDAAKEAAKQGREAAEQLQAGGTEPAKAAGEKAEQALRDAAKQGGPAGEKAGQLADQQQRLNQQMADVDPKAAAAQQQKQQQKLGQQAGQLADQLDQAAKEPGQPTGDPGKMKQAAEKLRQAQQQMDRANREDQAGRKPNADDARKQAEQALDQAQQQAGEAAGQAGDGKPGDGPPKPGKPAAGASVKAAENLMEQAAGDLDQKKPEAAADKMQKAADKLNDAAKQLGPEGPPKPGQTGEAGKKPGGNDGTGTKPADTAQLPADLKQYEGTPWGELPGEIKSRIIQDLQAKYGDDYARVIKLYFEQLADKK